MKILLWGLAAGLAVAAVVRAEPLEKSQVASTAQWVAHIDADAFRAAGNVQKIADGWLNRDPAKQQLTWLREEIGLDPAKDLRSITFYGGRVKLGRGVAIVRAAVDQKHLLAYLKKQPTYSTQAHGRHQLHVFEASADRGRKETVVTCLHRPAVIVFGRDVAEVTKALDVLDGKAASLGRDSPLAKDIPKGTILWLAATELGEAEMPFRSPFVRLSKQMLVALGEHDRDVFLKAKLVTTSIEDADRVCQAVDGFRAVAKQQSGLSEDIKTLLKGLEVSADGKTVDVSWRARGEDLAKMVETPRKRPSPHIDWRRRQEEHKKRFLEKYDKNRNGKIDDDEKEAIRAEWIEAMKERKAEYQKRLLEKYDTNKDGKLDDDEKDAIRAEWSQRMNELRKRRQKQ